MKVVLDTNIVISAVFFGGNPRTIIDKVLDDEILCFASQDILDEYHEVFNRMLKGKTNSFSSMVFRLYLDDCAASKRELKLEFKK